MERIGVHNLYQDLFLTDLKKEVVEANMETQQRVSEMSQMRKELNALRKDNRDLKAKLKSYRLLLSTQTDTSRKRKGFNERVGSPNLSDESAEEVDQLTKIELFKGFSNMDTSEFSERRLKDSPSGASSPLYRNSPTRVS